MKLELVVWDDAIACGGWEDLGKGDAPHRCNTLGFVTVDEPTHIVVAGTWAILEGEITTNQRMTIPRGFIVSRQVLDLDALRSEKVLKPLTEKPKKPYRSVSSFVKPLK